MKIEKSILVLGMSMLLWKTADSVDCYEPNQSKTRIFDSLVHYQGNKVPFSPKDVNWNGSNIEFSCKTISKIEKNDFVSYQSEAIISVKLSGKQISSIDKGAFISLMCLYHLELDHNNITDLSRNVFENLSRLKTLDLSYNQIELLKDFNFANLIKLNYLDLSHNRIKHIGNYAFSNVSLLEFLNLEQNEIFMLWYDVFRPLGNLQVLKLSHNKLSDIEPEKWGGLNKLQNLSIAANDLDHFDPAYNFSFSSLKFLNLSGNYLSMFNAAALKRHLPKLELLDINDNPWFCTDLQEIEENLKTNGIKLVSRNFSTVGINGIGCSDLTRFAPKHTTSSTTSTTVSNRLVSDVTLSKDEVLEIINEKIKKSDQELNNRIDSIRIYLIVVLSSLCVFILLYVLFKTSIFKNALRSSRREEDQLIDDNVENFRLLGT